MPDIKILVVEDEEVVAFDIETTLTDLGYEVPAAVAYGEEAIEQAASISKPPLTTRSSCWMMCCCSAKWTLENWSLSQPL
ncbi:MAG: hypothetical protein GDA43_13705 [Hormoscilla sp. SP5CHS1]|nr:hypothetical protein [Hormoscilla sp. SP12CHS1]MBC6454116.1 hypothetical protein [Hormoscilla sp. SP5CHS1]